MPMPTEDRVSSLVAALVEDRGYDLEGVRVTSAGKRSTVRVMVDDDAGVDLDAIAELSVAVSTALDDAGDFGETAYTLEVTTPGIDRPLTKDRHWRRAKGRVVKLSRAGESMLGRVGALRGDTVDIVVRGKSGPSVEAVPLAEIADAVVQVEFAPPDPRELALAGGVAAGRPQPGDTTDEVEADDTDSDGDAVRMETDNDTAGVNEK